MKKKNHKHGILPPLRIPKYSYSRGYTDEGVSDHLGKSPAFRYSERFLRAFYAPLIKEVLS